MAHTRRITRLTLWGTVAAIAAAVGLGITALTATASPGAPAASQPASFVPGTCGPWSAEHSNVTAAISAAHGPIRDCLRVGRTWVIVTSGSGKAGGAIGVLSCGISSACLDGWSNPGVSRMQWYRPAVRAGGATLLQVKGNNLIVDYAGYQLLFSLTSHKFAPMGSEKI